MKLTEFRQQASENATATVELFRGKLTITYKYAAMTPGMLRKAKRLSANRGTKEEGSDEEALDFMTGFLSQIILDWNLESEAGGKLPIARESFEEMSLEMIMTLADAITLDSQTRGNGSASSSETPSSESSGPKHRNGHTQSKKRVASPVAALPGR